MGLRGKGGDFRRRISRLRGSIAGRRRGLEEIHAAVVARRCKQKGRRRRCRLCRQRPLRFVRRHRRGLLLWRAPPLLYERIFRDSGRYNRSANVRRAILVDLGKRRPLRQVRLDKRSKALHRPTIRAFAHCEKKQEKKLDLP